ncbi:MAG: membrane dipeptidase [Thermoflexales bacterium]|nr:membrane dipeptidase [Thermoflexales bacterium]
MLIIDSHLDLAWNALSWERDQTASVTLLRQTESTVPGKGRALNTVALPEMRRGRVFLSFATLLSRNTGRTTPGIDYASLAQCHGMARGQLAYYRHLEAHGELRVIVDRAGLDAHVAAWQAWDKRHAKSADSVSGQPPLGVVISMEGADPISDPGELAEWHALGLRLIGPAHYGNNRYAGGTGTERPLTAGIGPALLKEMRRLNIAMDCTHLSDTAFWQAVKQFDGPLLASHQNCRSLVPMQRQFTDAQIKVILERDGVLGASFDISMVRPGWLFASWNNLTYEKPVMMREIVDHIDHICQLAGSSRHCALGTDLDGGFGREQSPFDLDTIADLQKMAGLLAGRGYSPADIEGILHGNWLRFLRALWPA